MHFLKKDTGPYSYLYCQYNEEDVIDYQLQMINRSDQNGFIRIKKDEELIYDVTALIPLEIYFKTQCQSFESQKHLLRKLIDSLWVADEYLLDIEKVVLDKSYIYIDSNKEQIKLVYLPIKRFTNVAHKCMKEIIMQLLFTVDISTIESDNRIKKMISYLQEPDFDMMVFYAMISSLKKDTRTQKGDWFKNLFNSDKKKQSETVYMGSREEYPILEFKSARVSVNKNSFLIGRSKQLADYAIPECLSMGRVHAEVIKDSDGYYLVDINSKNGTYINGERLESQKKYPLNKGDTLQFANETVYFK